MADVVELKSGEEIKAVRESAALATKVLSELKKLLAPGISARDIDAAALKMVRSYGAEPAFLGYRGFPASICFSVNTELVHGIPSAKRIVRSGDIVTIDLGVVYRGFYGDIAETVPVGKVDRKTMDLLGVTYGCFDAALASCIDGKRVGDIGSSVQSFVESRGYSVVRSYVGHGIGRRLHEKPEVPNFGRPGTGHRLIDGMVICIEPMVTSGSHEVVTLEDGWTVETADGSMCAHYEHMVLIKKDGCEVLTELNPVL